LAVVFPFEQAFYAAHGCSAEFVGHPLVDRVRPTRSRAETLQQYQLDPQRQTIALLPGSRTQELRYLLDPLLRAATNLGNTYQFILPVASILNRTEIEKNLSQNLSGPLGPAAIRVVQDDTYNVIHAADLAIVASGTATLETALLERPMVIVYRVAPLTYTLARLFVDLPFFGMPNLIAERRVVPELLQTAVTPDRIAHEARQLLTNPQAYSVAQEGLREVRRRLGGGGAAERTAALILNMLEKN
jgi:lipid-A-disaccharide synthase